MCYLRYGFLEFLSFPFPFPCMGCTAFMEILDLVLSDKL